MVLQWVFLLVGLLVAVVVMLAYLVVQEWVCWLDAEALSLDGPAYELMWVKR